MLATGAVLHRVRQQVHKGVPEHGRVGDHIGQRVDGPRDGRRRGAGHFALGVGDELRQANALALESGTTHARK